MKCIYKVYLQLVSAGINKRGVGTSKVGVGTSKGAAGICRSFGVVAL